MRRRLRGRWHHFDCASIIAPMQLGIVVPVEQSASVKSSGYDFVEETVPRLLQGQVPDEQWTGAVRAANCVVPLIAANMLVPGSLKITGPEASMDKLRP